ncbi:GNAT family N-acetyltransferase [Parapedobacter koreensis]|uniref:Protein N-acetyltransferase, RimJ/RimL family n=1 Tax=Parapedobacter koreensis TaxID=332977 RepID=A0A1H7TGI5_9SPHI|nr:GNAT family N-acetyltransferase [Parapedobacter koreensis]SEL83823.1 Protein N-acetyltransferase, RimJ/RimL family [Parapedobacter koreensis]
MNQHPIQMIPFPIPPQLENDQALLLPLLKTDFEALYALASDPAIWAQHPQPDRWKPDVFRAFFEGAIQSGSAYKIFDKATDKLAGTTRFYDYNPATDSIAIGYTFLAVRHWGTGLNRSVKQLLLDYAFRWVSNVIFHVGATNYRSQQAVMKLGAQKAGEMDMAAPGAPSKPYFVYALHR